MKSKKELFQNLPRLKPDSKIMLLTHTDLDGEMPAVLLKSAFEDVSVIHCPNNIMDEKIKTTVLEYADNYDFIIACDISCTKDTAGWIDNNPNRNKFVLLDHHATAEHLNEHKWACVYPDMVADSFRAKCYSTETIGNSHSSGTALLYDYMEYNGLTDKIPNNDLMQKMVQLTSGYDTWDWHDIFDDKPEYKKLNDLYYLYGAETFESSMLEKLNNNETTVFNKYDNMFLDIDRRKIDETVNRLSKSFKTGTITIDNKPYSMVLCFTDLYQSDVFTSMKTNIPDMDLYIINHSNGVSLRTEKDDINVAEIAKAFGGGGHPKASGIPIAMDNKIQFLADELKAEIEIDETAPYTTATPQKSVIKPKKETVTFESDIKEEDPKKLPTLV